MGQHWSHLTPTKRIQLDAFIRAGMKPTDIAKELGVHHTTIYRELKRCTYEHLNSDYTTETRYNPEGAQARYEANLRAKGPELKIGNDYELADYLIAKIRDEKYSPEAAIGEAEVKGWPFKTHICASTAYNYIRGEIFGDELTVSMLPQHGKRHQPERPAGSMPRKPAGRSIEDRPEHINDRSTFGHWEMDSVESCQGVSNTYIVMTERKTRWELIIPSPDKTAASVVAAIDGLEAKYGDLFPKVFRSITCDNGCEFADAAGIERSASGKGTRTESTTATPTGRVSADQRNPNTANPAARSERHRPQHNLRCGNQADRGMAQQLPAENVRLSVLRAAFPRGNGPHSGLIKNIFAFLCIYS